MDITSQLTVSPQPIIAGSTSLGTEGNATYQKSTDPYISAVPRPFASPLLNGLVPAGRLAGSGTPTLAGTSVTIPAGSHYFISDGAGGVVHVYFPVAVVLAGVAASNYVYAYLSVGADGQTYTVQLETAAAVPTGALSIGQNSAGTWADTAGIEKLGAISKMYLTINFPDLTALPTFAVYVPVKGTVTKLIAVTEVAVTTHNAVLTASIGTTAITTGVVTVATGGALGDINSATPTAANAVVPGNYIKVVETGTGGSPGAGAAMLMIEITLS